MEERGKAKVNKVKIYERDVDALGNTYFTAYIVCQALLIECPGKGFCCLLPSKGNKGKHNSI
jgi:hypothetical protein